MVYWWFPELPGRWLCYGRGWLHNSNPWRKGNEIATLVNEEKPAGNYEVEFNASILPSGVYFGYKQALSLRLRRWCWWSNRKNIYLFKPLWMNVNRGFKILEFLHLFQLFKQNYCVFFFRTNILNSQAISNFQHKNIIWLYIHQIIHWFPEVEIPIRLNIFPTLCPYKE